ncbi:hypothetical protein [Streptomyces sp. KS 21]|uniref:hypothetical protein n=1 Tax=Streptomyces sp. KS 21 TaxID=2485150 RepID=UPI0014152F61
MRTTVPAGYLGRGAPTGWRPYGLGLVSRPLSCDDVYWGHGGDIPGYETRGGATEDGRAVSVAVTVMRRTRRPPTEWRPWWTRPSAADRGSAPARTVSPYA